jgi:hypothetical protein
MVYFEKRSALRTTVDYFIERVFPLATFDTSEICFIHHSLLISPRSGGFYRQAEAGEKLECNGYSSRNKYSSTAEFILNPF